MPRAARVSAWSFRAIRRTWTALRMVASGLRISCARVAKKFFRSFSLSRSRSSLASRSRSAVTTSRRVCSSARGLMDSCVMRAPHPRANLAHRQVAARIRPGAGTSRRIRVPRPSRPDSACTVAPCTVAISRTMASPRPQPSRLDAGPAMEALEDALALGLGDARSIIGQRQFRRAAWRRRSMSRSSLRGSSAGHCRSGC